MSNDDAAQQKTKFQKHIAGLRAVSITLVLLAHYGVLGFSGGFIGVDIFFVISGYLITGLLMREYESKRNPVTRTGSLSLKNFYVRRAKRLMPVALLVSFSIITWTYFNFNSVRFSTTLNDFAWAQLFSANNNLAMQDSSYFLQGSGLSPFRHFWSLSVEEQFYFVWPALLIAAISFQALKFRGVALNWWVRVLVALSVVTLASFACMLVLEATFPVGSYYLIVSRAWELGIGGMASIIVFNFGLFDRIRFSTGWISNCALALTVLSLTIFSSSNGGPRLAVPVISAAVFIAAGQAGSSFSTRLLSLWPFQFLGKISYSLYLWHWPLLVFAGQGGYLHSGLDWVTLVALTFTLSCLSYYFVERPLISMKWPIVRSSGLVISRVNRVKVTSGSLALVLLVIAIPAVAVFPAGREISSRAWSSIGSIFKTAADSPRPQEQVRPVATPLASTGSTVDQVRNLFLAREKIVIKSIFDSRSGLGPTETQRKNILESLGSASWRDETGWTCKQVGQFSQSRDCQIGSQSAKKHWIVIGDSQAAQYRAALRRIVENFPEIDVRLIYSEECPNALGLAGLRPAEHLSNPGENVGCQYTHKIVFSEMEKTKFDFAFLSDDSDGAGALYAVEAVKFGQYVRNHSVSSAVMSPLPGSPDLATCLNRDFTNLDKCSGSPNLNHSDDAVAQKLGVPLISAQALFCYGSTCPVLVGDFPVSSFGHLDKNQAYFSGDLFAELIKTVAPKSF